MDVYLYRMRSRGAPINTVAVLYIRALDDCTKSIRIETLDSDLKRRSWRQTSNQIEYHTITIFMAHTT